MHTLVISMPPWQYATRTRKAAISYAQDGQVTFIAPQGVGRTGKWDEAGARTEEGVDIVQVPVRALDSRPGKKSMVRNLVSSYLPAVAQLARKTQATPAEVVHVTGAPLIPLALAHRRKFGSTLVLDVNERPASVSSSGSLFGIFSRVEPRLLRAAARAATVTSVVTEGHADLLKKHHGWNTPILVVRNAPVASWRADWTPPPPGPLRVVTVGTLFERRGFELIIKAARLCRDAGTDIEIHIHGSGRPEYIQALERLIAAEGVTDRVHLHPPVPRDDVSTTYLTGHLGLAFYEPSDPGNDSLSNKIIECIASGRPVLAGDLPENRRFIEQTEGGWLTDLTSQAITDQLLNIAAQDLTSATERCRDIADQFTWESEFAPVMASVHTKVSQDARS